MRTVICAVRFRLVLSANSLDSRYNKHRWQYCARRCTVDISVTSNRVSCWFIGFERYTHIPPSTGYLSVCFSVMCYMKPCPIRRRNNSRRVAHKLYTYRRIDKWHNQYYSRLIGRVSPHRTGPRCRRVTGRRERFRFQRSVRATCERTEILSV